MKLFEPDALEKDILGLWEREGTFAASLRRREGARRYSFYDGPPYATGLPHYGNILQTTVKDTVTRYWTMRGFLVDRRVGWDCHGLPVEHMVEKELGLKTKRDIEQRGVEAFNAACRAAVLRHVDHWTALLRRLGRWADYDHAYVTMDAGFIESAWWVFKVAWDHGLVYKGLRSSPYCPRCETTLSHHEVSLGYKDVTDPSLTVKVRLADEETTYLLVWTTTPWTLPGNTGIAVHPDMRYVRVRVGDETWILAKERLAEVVREDCTLEDEFLGSVLVGRSYVPIYAFVEPDKPAYRVVAAPFVDVAEGTGLVHIAPAFGEEDFQLAAQANLPVAQVVDASGRFLSSVTPWAGMRVKEADPLIIKDLDAQGKLHAAETIQHSYPHCWRCETPLLYLATTSWFISVTAIKERLLRNAEAIQWVPEHVKDGRFGQGLRDAPDWAVSRSRFWGIPLPVWECAACEHPTVVGSIRELTAAGGDLSLLKSPHADPDLHRPYIDRMVLRCAHCGREARRVPEVLDVWFDSGSMPYGQWHYPFENKELVESTFPADFIGEALEMTRGWFYTLHVLAGILTLEDRGLGLNQPAFTHAITSGLILAEDGRKLSKRLGNYPDPGGLVAKYGADTLRLLLLSATRFGEDMRFSDRLVGELYRRFTLLLWNVWQYYRTYLGDGGTKVPTPRPQHPSLLDRWVLARTAKLAADVQAAMDSYHIDDAARALIPFVEDLSTWYVRRSRGREDALPVLAEVLRQFSLIAAPFIPFLTEHIHRELTGASPHLEDWPTVQPPRLYDTTSEVGGVGVLEQMRVIRDLASAGHRARAAAKIKVRQPLAEAVIVGEFPALIASGDEGLALLRGELNVKKVSLTPTSEVSADSLRKWVWGEREGGKVGLQTELTEELKQEGMVRDLIRAVQDLRRQANYQFDDVITLVVETDHAPIRAALEKFLVTLKEETKSADVRFERSAADVSTELAVAGAHLWVGVRKS